MNKINNLLTIVIVSYKSSKLVIPFLNKFSKLFKIIIIENSRDLNLQRIIKKKYKKNVDIFLRNNIGFGSAINYASKFIKTKYFFSVNPDLDINLVSIKNLIKAAKKLNGVFGGVEPINTHKKKHIKSKIINEVDSINGSAMFFSTAIFKKIKGFDKNIWLFFEENDFCRRAKNLGYKFYTISNAQAFHEGGKSMTDISSEENYQMTLTRSWHSQWSRYYFYKKHFGILKALQVTMPKSIKLIFQITITTIYSPKKSQIYIYKIYGIICSMLDTSSFVRPSNKNLKLLKFH